MRIEHPYQPRGPRWLRGNLHTHTTMSDGEKPPQTVIDHYHARGYDFLAITDHDQITDVSAYDLRGMVLIPSNEITANAQHLLHINAAAAIAPEPDRQTVLDNIHKDRGFAIFVHPNWSDDFDHTPIDQLTIWDGYLGIEIYNAVCRRDAGSPYATNKWDILLSNGRKVWGFAHDDAHIGEDFCNAWLMVGAPERTAESILAAIQNGNFYCSTGVHIRTIAVDDETNTITVESDNASAITVHANGGRRVGRTDGNTIGFTIPPSAPCGYVRFELWGEGEKKAWTQPFFLRS